MDGNISEISINNLLGGHINNIEELMSNNKYIIKIIQNGLYFKGKYLRTEDGELFFNDIEILRDGNWENATIPSELLVDEFNDVYEINKLNEPGQRLSGQNQILPGQGGKRKYRKTKKMRKSRK